MELARLIGQRGIEGLHFGSPEFAAAGVIFHGEVADGVGGGEGERGAGGLVGDPADELARLAFCQNRR